MKSALKNKLWLLLVKVEAVVPAFGTNKGLYFTNLIVHAPNAKSAIICAAAHAQCYPWKFMRVETIEPVSMSLAASHPLPELFLEAMEKAEPVQSKAFYTFPFPRID